ncbi:hypothetical protein I6N90_05825 [Paenibacillus sp. GSMTC-2017]|uniref:hypothetical protein n=1 Tax=Paenibacillus sp. GSMTC-2017 TaxID=2794350 RepID=UPI0018D699A0|nr:hypothetical protein [Paenibacillus sp. GSMTC-2017]MBH5317330.1 hypothetical protein [Paenibacillus sp. GSMTC-2017]
MVQPMTAKELEYIADSMSNEDLLIKQAAATLAVSTTPAIRNYFSQVIQTHQQHYDSLLHAISHHQQIAPTQPQQ